MSEATPAPAPAPAAAPRASTWKYTLGLVAGRGRDRVPRPAPFPPLCSGVPHNLSPELRAQVAQAFAAFQFASTGAGKRSVPQGKTKFAPVNYEKDWESVRKIDETLSHLLDGK